MGIVSAASGGLPAACRRWLDHSPYFVVTIFSERLIPGRRTANDALTGLEVSL